MRFALVLVAACSSPSDPVITHDSSVPDADLAAHCLIAGNYGALGAITGTAKTSQSGDTTLTFVLDNGATGKDDLFFRFVAGKGAFAGGVAAGTYSITGADASYPSCGLCTNLIADITSSGPAKFYFAASGTVTLNSVTAPVTGTAANLHFTEIDISTGATVSDCVGDIASVSFTAN